MGGVYTHARGGYGSVWRKGLRKGLMNLGRETFFGMMKISFPEYVVVEGVLDFVTIFNINILVFCNGMWYICTIFADRIKEYGKI